MLVDKYTISNETTILLRLLDPKLFKRYQIDIDGLKVGDVEVETANPIPPHIPPTITTVHTGFPLIRMANTSTMPTSSPYDWSMRQHNYGTSSSASGGGGRDRKGIAMYTNQDGLKTTAGATYNASINCFNFNDASSWSLIDFNGVFSGGAYHQPVAFNGSGRYDQLVTTQYVQLMTTLSTATAAPITGGLVGGVVSVYGVV